MQRVRFLAVIALSVGMATHFAEAAPITIKALEFNSVGILPSAEPDIVFINNTGSLEGSLYSVSGGFLQQRTLPVSGEVVGNASYLFPNLTITGGGLSSALSTAMEVEINVLDVTSSVPQNSGIVFQAFDGANRYTAFLTPTGVDLITSTVTLSVPFDVSGLHTYRIESPANNSEGRLFIDGVFQASWTAPAIALNGFTFGDGITDPGNAGNADWNYVRVLQDAELTNVVTIDIKPGGDPNSINPRSKGVIPVAILTTETFDASTVDQGTVEFGPNGAAPVHGALEDVDGDGDLDLILHFRTQDTGIQCGDISASVTGQTTGEQAISASDAVNTVGCS